jgi:hypothetical protein
MEPSGLQAHQSLLEVATLTTPSSQIIPYGLCQCGCGRATTVAPQAIKRLGLQKGEHFRFVFGHNSVIRCFPEEAQPFKIDGVYCRVIPLTRGMFAIVDEADYWILACYKWCAYWATGTKSFYAVRTGDKAKCEPRTVLMHRQILGLQKGDRTQGDHKESGHTWDNRRNNLRRGTKANNGQNQRVCSRNTSGMRGVDRNQDGSYRVRIMVDGRRINVGSSKDFDKACEMRVAALLKYHQEFANDGTNWKDKPEGVLARLE